MEMLDIIVTQVLDSIFGRKRGGVREIFTKIALTASLIATIVLIFWLYSKGH
jgi:small basic protein